MDEWPQYHPPYPVMLGIAGSVHAADWGSIMWIDEEEFLSRAPVVQPALNRAAAGLNWLGVTVPYIA